MSLTVRLALALVLGFVAYERGAGALGGDAVRAAALGIVVAGVLLMVLPRPRPAAPKPSEARPEAVPPSPIEQAQASGKPPHPRTLREMQRQYQRLYEQERERQHRRQ